MAEKLTTIQSDLVINYLTSHGETKYKINKLLSEQSPDGMVKLLEKHKMRFVFISGRPGYKQLMAGHEILYEQDSDKNIFKYNMRYYNENEQN
jgi:hypothetical protein